MNRLVHVSAWIWNNLRSFYAIPLHPAPGPQNFGTFHALSFPGEKKEIRGQIRPSVTQVPRGSRRLGPPPANLTRPQSQRFGPIRTYSDLFGVIRS
jgi:hypothetical protein